MKDHNQMSDLPQDARAAIRIRRLERGLTQPEAAKIGEVSVATWNAIENGRSAGSEVVRAQICKALGWTVDSIDRLVLGQPAIDGAAAGATDNDDDVDDALATLAAAVERLIAEVAAQRRLIDELVAAELGRRRQ